MVQPEAIFYLAAAHHSSEEAPPSDPDLLAESWTVNVAGPANFLHAIAENSPKARFFYAASSMMFGAESGEIQTEDTPCNPESIYGITKCAGWHTCRYFRRSRQVRASVGILYNHESPYRRDGFVARRIVTAAVRIARGEEESLSIGDLEARIDWGYAPDFVDAFLRIVELPEGDDFIVSTGEAHTVGDFVAIAFERVGLDWKRHVRSDPDRLKRRNPVRIGDNAKLRSLTGWTPTVTFREMVEILVDAERDRSAA